MRLAGRLAVSILGLLTLVGCRSASDFTFDEDSRAPDVVRCEDFVVPQQFGLGWRNLNHRISVLKIRTDEACDAQALDVGFLGGGYSRGPIFHDRPMIEFGWQRVERRPEFAAARVSIRESLSEEGLAESTKFIARDVAGLLDYDHVVALIQGVEFRTDVDDTTYDGDYDATMGFTSRGLGVSVDVSGSDDSVIDLDYKIRFETGTAPDRGNLNVALSHARIFAVVDVLLIGMQEDAASFGSVSFGSHYKSMALSPRHKVLAPEDERLVTLSGSAGGPMGAFGFSSFDFQLDFRRRCAKTNSCDLIEDEGAEAPGGYIRKLLAAVELDHYDTDTGTLQLEVEGYATTLAKSFALRPMQQRFDANIVWLQIDGGQDPQWLSQAFRAGETVVPLR